jgi:hypothetical protein
MSDCSQALKKEGTEIFMGEATLILINAVDYCALRTF